MSDPRVGGGWHFNAPPGWPVPPGWIPPAGWTPDPSWPPAPPGWQFWIPAGGAPAGPGPIGPGPFGPGTIPPRPEAPTIAEAPRSGLFGRASLFVKVVAGFLTLAATVIGAYFAIKDRPDPYTIADWARKANSICEKDFGAVQTTAFVLTPLLAQAIAKTPASGTNNENLAQLIKTVADMASAFRAMTGDLRAVDLPKGYDDTEIQRLLTSGNDVSNALGVVASFLVNFEIGKASLVDGQNAINKLQLVMGSSLPAWSRSASQLGLNQCLLIVGDGATPTIVATTPPPSGGLNAAEQSLVDAVNPAVLTGCTSTPGEENSNVLAAVNCDAARTGPSKRPLVLRFVSAQAQSDYLGRQGVGFTSSSCAAGRYKAPWQRSGSTTNLGTLVCTEVDSGGFQLIWTFDNDNIVVFMDAKDGGTAYDWWKANAYLLKQAS